jgi:hypothetical protein
MERPIELIAERAAQLAGPGSPKDPMSMSWSSFIGTVSDVL